MKTLKFFTAIVCSCAFCTIAWAGTALDSIAVIDSAYEIEALDVGTTNSETSDVEARLSLLLGTNAATMTAGQWAEYSDVLGDALHSEVEGLRFAALRLAIQYSDDLTLDRSAIHDMAAMYRSHRNDNVRRMAVVALGSTDDSWAIDYLKRSVPFEKTPRVLHTLKAVLQPEIIVGEPEAIGAR
ncbi:MAG: hypothetical protein KJO98_14200 [Rhodothermia bacterium]|nr:hypothetical protein [Rhodothermia bacterium]